MQKALMWKRLVFAFAVVCCANSAFAVSGHVVDAKGAPIAAARVFAEPGQAGALLQTTSASDGSWRFDALPSASPLGIFAVADGLAYGGVTLNSASGPETDIKIRLFPQATISGRVVNHKKDPVSGARVTRLGLLGADKVGVPLAKLKAFGVEEPVTDSSGHFEISRIPEGGRVAIKIAHSDYAQEAVDDVAAGDSDLKITLNPGILLEGDVLARDNKASVGDASVVIRNAQPPFDTAVTRTNGAGHFALRLKPGVYMIQASTAGLQSAGWQRIALTGEEPAAHGVIYIAGIGRIHGKVCNAISGLPVPDAKISLDSQGNAASVTRTDAKGEFVIPAAEGENIVRLDSASGFRPPEQPSLKIQVVAEKDVALPPFWLAPLPTYTVEVVDENMKPTSDAVVTILRPLQFGWRVTDAQGRVTIQFSSLPPDGVVVGMVEHAREPLGAVFAIKQEQANPARVELFPMGYVSGRVVNSKSKPVAGCMVAGLLGDNGMPLWRTISGPDGGFKWGEIVPRLPQRLFAGENEAENGIPYTIEPSSTKDLGDVSVSDGPPRTSLLGAQLPWTDVHSISGEVPDRKLRKSQPMIVVYCSAADAQIAVESFTVAHQLFASKGLAFAVVIDGAPTESLSAPFPILSGRTPGPATTYLTGRDGNVVLETFGMPPLRALQDLTK
jgi:hypothetical protein